ncbi:hypothetical protein [Anaeromyxobacter sp. SG17]|uniref:hypothetical protein n=1 Tax=Anaeromyxobacter sp. SG17 TaxID=2925405 RepID=UPI001F5A83D9|nr:hypothetical protein [Anaeromyxobacter sp. SG17]
MADVVRSVTVPLDPFVSSVPAGVKVPARIDFRVALALVGTDAGFVLLHLGRHFGWLPDDPMLSLSQDRGCAEWFQYAKELSVLLLLGIARVRKRSTLLAVLALLYLYLLLDDSLRIHEVMGSAVAASGLLPEKLGQPAWAAAVGSMFLVPLGLGYLRSDADTRRFARWLLGLTALLAGFGVVIDFALAGLRGGALIEEIGELLVMSATVTFVLGVFPPGSRTRKALERGHLR